jgi:hypothetical protein
LQAFNTGQMNFNKEATSFLLIKAVYDNAGDVNHIDGYVDIEVPSDTLIGPMSVSLLGYFLDLITNFEMAGKFAVGYKVWSEGDMYVKPGVTVSYGSATQLGRTEAVPGNILMIEVPVEIGLAANPLTTLTVAYGKNNLLADPIDAGAIYMTLKVTY